MPTSNKVCAHLHTYVNIISTILIEMKAMISQWNIRKLQKNALICCFFLLNEIKNGYVYIYQFILLVQRLKWLKRAFSQ